MNFKKIILKYKMFLSSGKYHTSAIDENGLIYSWGDNSYEQLNIPALTGRRSELPHDSEEYKTIKFISISSGWGHTSAIDENGFVYSWGYNFYGQLNIPKIYKTIKFVFI